MEIAFIHPSYPDSEGTGSTHDATQIVNTLKNLGHEVVPYCLSAPEDGSIQHELLSIEGFPPHTLTQLNRAVIDRREELATFDVVHSYLPLIPALNDLPAEVSTVVTLDSYKAICPKMDLRYMDEEMCRENGVLRCAACSIATSGGHTNQSRAYRSISRLGDLRLITKMAGELQIDGFQAISPHVKKIYTRFGYPEERITVISNILDKKFLVDHQSDFTPPYKLLHVGYLRKAKGVQMLPEVMHCLLDRSDYNFEMTVVGTGALKDELEATAAELGVDHAMDFRGFIEDHDELPGIYANHDMFVYPGLWDEPFGRVFIESLAAGTPIVGTDVGAVREIVGDAGEVTDTSPESLAAKILEMVSSSKLERYSSYANGQAERYRPEIVGLQFDNLYTNIT